VCGWQLITAAKPNAADVGHRARAKQWPLREIYLWLANKVSIFKITFVGWEIWCFESRTRSSRKTLAVITLDTQKDGLFHDKTTHISDIYFFSFRL
jgi:hypothetical protein